MKVSLEWLSEFLPNLLSGKDAQSVAQAAGDALLHGGLPVENIERHGHDPVLDVEVTSNRSDCLSHLGVARELAALMNLRLVEPDDAKAAASLSFPASASVPTSVTSDATDLCPHYIARVIDNVRIGPSPAWMVRRLEAIGLRSINNVVDVTNYVMFEIGQPLHAFDFDKLDGRRIVVRRARAGEKMFSLDGKERELASGMLVIADAARPATLAGVMGGRDSEVSPQTTRILLESARFDPLSIRKTGRALAMKSDSSYRFERGLDPALAERASVRAAQLIAELTGGQIAGPPAVAGPQVAPPPLRQLSLRLARLKSVLGIDIPADEAIAALRRLRFSPQLRSRSGNDEIAVTVPTDRLDINLEIDLVEEVARVVGYGHIPVREEISIRVVPLDPAASMIDAIRSALVAGGYYEAVTFSFISDLLAGDFLPIVDASSQSPSTPAAAALLRTDASVRKTDAHLRPSLLPGLLQAVVHNENAGTAGARFFEIGSAFTARIGAPGESMANPIDERRRLALVGSNDLREIRGVLEAVLAKLDPDRPLRVIPAVAAGFSSEAAGRIEWGGQPIGVLGKIDHQIADKLGLREAPAAAELELTPLLAGAQLVRQLKPLPRYPAVRRDLSLIVVENLRYAQLEDLIHANQPAELEDLEYVTTYRGKPLEKGQKSITVALSFRSPLGTLAGEQVESVVQRIVAAAEKQLGATLRK